LQASSGLSLLFITHDLAHVRSIADRVAILHDGSLMEIGPTADICDDPTSEYAQALVRNTPDLERSAAGRR
jgi:peptide/nickel transport system ATP-binding protein